MTSHRGHRVLLCVAVALAVAGAVAACVEQVEDNPLGAGTTTTTSGPDASDRTTTTGPEGFTPEPIEWESCQYEECATLEVPLDYEDPDAGTIEIFASRTPAKDDRIGALFVNPGGPGAGGADFAAILGFLLPDEVLDRFDIVGVDPRGTGQSTPIDCGVPADELYGADATIEDEADRQALLDVSKAYVDDCADKYGDILQHVGTRDVARDMDSVRAAMGDDQLSYLGFSYGTAIGQVYADLFPDRVRAMVLDGVLELGPSGLDLAAEQAKGFETALSRWVDYCTGNPECETGDDPLGAVEQVLALSEEPGGIPSSSGRDAGPGEATLGITLPLYTTSQWGNLDDALDEALAGDAEGLVDLADQYIGIGDFEVYFAVNCLDFTWPDDPQSFLDAAKAAAEDSPHFGEALVNDYIRCVDWPVTREPLTAVEGEGTPPIVVVSTTGDPATPYEAGVNVADRLAHGVLVTYKGDGHTVVANGVPCIDDMVTRYLVDLEAPEDGLTCR